MDDQNEIEILHLLLHPLQMRTRAKRKIWNDQSKKSHQNMQRAMQILCKMSTLVSRVKKLRFEEIHACYQCYQVFQYFNTAFIL